MTRRVRYRLLAFATLSGMAVAGCGREEAEAVESASVVDVRVAPVTVGDVRAVVRATAVVTPAPGADLVVVAPEAARIAEIPRGAGEPVRAGDVLVRFEIPALAADVQKQQAEVARAAAAVETTGAGLTRARELFDRGVAARKEVEEGTRAVADAEAALVQARAALAAAETIASRATVRAAFDGVIVKRSHNPGDVVEAAASDPVLRVIDPRRLELVAWVPLADVMRVEAGAAAHVVDPPATVGEITLKVLSRATVVEPGTAAAAVRLQAGTAGNLPVGTTVQVEIEADRHQHVVLAPAAAIVREGDETAVFVVRDGKAHRQVVTLGLHDGGRVEIVSGVAAGESVIVDGQAGLPDEATIRVVAEPAAQPGGPPPPARGKDQRP